MNDQAVATLVLAEAVCDLRADVVSELDNLGDRIASAVGEFSDTGLSSLIKALDRQRPETRDLAHEVGRAVTAIEGLAREVKYSGGKG